MFEQTKHINFFGNEIYNNDLLKAFSLHNKLNMFILSLEKGFSFYPFVSLGLGGKKSDNLEILGRKLNRA